MSFSLRSRIRQACLLGCVSGAALCAVAVGQASAATSVSVAVNSTFDGGQEGWTTAANEQNSLVGSLLCLEGLTCPKVTDAYQPTGGVEGSGYIETKEGGVASVGLLAESAGAWESPEFTYLGVAGQQPTKVELTIARRAGLAKLLALPGAQATYSVELIDKTTPSGSVVVTNAATLAGAEEWKQASIPVSPTVLTVGDAYKVRIRTSFVTPVAVVPAGGVGYDDVALTASMEEAEGPRGKEGQPGPEGPSGPEGSGGGGGTPTGPTGSNGPSGTNGSSGPAGGTRSTGNGGSAGAAGTEGTAGQGGLSSAQLRGMIASQGLAGATLRNGRLIVTGRCPKSVPRSCTVRLRGMLNRRDPATSTRRARIAKGGKHNFAVALTPRARHKLQSQSKILVKEWVRAGKARATVYKRLKLVRR